MMVTFTGIMTAVTISKSLHITILFLLRKAIRYYVSSIRVKPTDIKISLALVAFYNIIRLSYAIPRVKHRFELIHKFIGLQHCRLYYWVQCLQNKTILRLHQFVCSGPRIKQNATRNNHRKFRKRSAGFGQWRLRKFKVRLNLSKACHGEVKVIQASMAKYKRKPKVTFDVESRPVGLDTQASKSICIDPSMMTNLRPANLKVVSLILKQCVSGRVTGTFQ